jgi:hypothetical protein
MSAAVTKAAAIIMSDERGRRAVGWIIVAIFAPLLVFIALICSLLLGGSKNNVSVTDLCWYGGAIPNGVSAEYQQKIIQTRSNFAEIDANASGTGLDANFVKAVYFALFFGSEEDVDIAMFVKCFTDTGGVGVYAEIENVFGVVITDENRANIQSVYSRVTRGGDTFSGTMERGENKDTELDVTGFVNPNVKNNLDLVVFVTHAWESGWGYVWGTFGGVLTESALASKLEQYPDEVGGYEEFIRENWLDGRTVDCVGMIKSYGWFNPNTLKIVYNNAMFPDNGANSMHTAASVKGAIATMPDTPGLGVWHHNHIGVYIGNGEVIEAMGTKYGVVKSKLADRSWTDWLEIPGISYN